MANTKIDKMVNRFLGWKLPQDFGPDCGINFTPFHPNGTTRFEPVGTNLLTAEQARQMFEHVTSDECTEGLQPHQQRVVTEKTELDEKIDKLTAFIDTPVFAGLDEAEQGRLVQQLHYMGHYTAVLGERIAAF